VPSLLDKPVRRVFFWK